LLGLDGSMANPDLAAPSTGILSNLNDFHFFSRASRPSPTQLRKSSSAASQSFQALTGTSRIRMNSVCPLLCLWFAKRPFGTSSAPLTVTRLDRQRAFSTRTRSAFDGGTSEQTQLTPAAASIAAAVTSSAYAA
jgi:hypothetical protein